MAEKKEAKKEEAAAGGTDIGAGTTKKVEKQAWTIERVKRAAKRFTTRDAWRAGAPASYKAAEAKGWMNQCCGHMTTTTKSSRKSA
jgi:hypothetical protein